MMYGFDTLFPAHLAVCVCKVHRLNLRRKEGQMGTPRANCHSQNTPESRTLLPSPSHDTLWEHQAT